MNPQIESMMMQQAAILTHAAGGKIVVQKSTVEQAPKLQLFKEMDANGNMVFRTEIEQ